MGKKKSKGKSGNAKKGDSAAQNELQPKTTTAEAKCSETKPTVTISPNPVDVYYLSKAKLTATGKNPDTGTYTWSADGATVTSNSAEAEVSSTKAGSVTVQVTYHATADVQASATVNFVDVQVAKSKAIALPPASKGGSAEISYDAEGTPSPGAYVWTITAKNECEASKQDDTGGPQVTITAAKPGTALIELQYRVVAKTRTRATYYRIDPEIVAVLFESGKMKSADFTALGTPDDGTFAWTIGDNTCEAQLSDPADGKKVTVKTAKAGAAIVKLRYTPKDGKSAERTANAAAVFVDEMILFKTVEDGTKTKLGRVKGKDMDVVLGLANDPAAWRIGQVVLEAEGSPAQVAIPDSTAIDGTHQWTPPANGFVTAAATQPSAGYGVNKANILLNALPVGGAGPAANPGFVEETVKVEYTICGKTAPDQVKVKVHRFACSQVHWQRTGTGVTTADRIVVCDHDANPVCAAITNREDPTDLGGSMTPRGHHHGGWCPWCSGPNPNPRDVWHYVATPSDLVAIARALADQLLTFARTKVKPATGPNLFTNNCYDYLRPAQNDGSRGYSAKMFGVLRSGSTVLYGLSGWWGADGDWSPPLNFGPSGSTSRSIMGYAGTSTPYTNSSAPFSNNITVPWEQFGRCAATAILADAMRSSLPNIEMTEVWLQPNPNMPSDARVHNTEVGSCEQCRRYLGRLLCEFGRR